MAVEKIQKKVVCCKCNKKSDMVNSTKVLKCRNCGTVCKLKLCKLSFYTKLMFQKNDNKNLTLTFFNTCAANLLRKVYVIIKIIKMLYYDRIGVSEGIDVNKTSPSKLCDVCHYWYFSDDSFKFQPNVCNRCHDLLMMSINFRNFAILNIKGFDYRCIISLFSINEAINVL